MADKIEKIIADTFLQMAEGLETGSFGKKPRIALTGMGSEHGEENAMEAAKMAAKDGIDVYYIGTLEADGITTVKVADDEEGHKKMEAVVDLVTEERKPLAKLAKDAAAGAVLIAAIMAAIAGMIIFIPKLLESLSI